jgi:hypothetical protein
MYDCKVVLSKVTIKILVMIGLMWDMMLLKVIINLILSIHVDDKNSSPPALFWPHI